MGEPRLSEMDSSSYPTPPNFNHVKINDVTNAFNVHFAICKYCLYIRPSSVRASTILQSPVRMPLLQLGSTSEIGSYSNSSAGSLFNSTIYEATPPQCPVGTCEYDVALSCSHILQMCGYQARCWEEPSSTNYNVSHRLDSNIGENKEDF